MLPIQKILLPVDFSRQGAAAASHAASLARRFQAELTLLHVNPVVISGTGLPGELTGPIDTGWVKALEAQRLRELREWHSGTFLGLNVKHEVLTGDPATEIVEFADKNQVDLIVMATHGYGGFRKFLIGSVAAKVLHDVHCPVWTGAHLADGPARDLKQMTNILCAIDGGFSSERVLRWSKSLAEEFQAELTVLNVISPLDAIETYLNFDLRRARVAAAESTIRCLLVKVGAAANVIVAEGDPAKVIAHEATGADIAVIGRADGHSDRLREHAYSIIRSAPCPVVSV